MKKKYIIHDEDGNEYKVEETVEEQHDEDIEEVKEETRDDEFGLTSDEIAALKRLAAFADKLIDMAKPTDDEDEDEDEEEIEEIEEVEEDEDEEVVDTECGRGTRDSKSSFNAIEKRVKKINDNADPDEDVNRAWAKRYNGGK